MIDPESAKNYFALLGIIYFSIKVVTGTATLHDKIYLWGWKKGIARWLSSE